MMWYDAPRTLSRPWPAAHWTENTVEARGLEYVREPEQAIASLLAWSAVVVAAGAAVTASALMAASRWMGGSR